MTMTTNVMMMLVVAVMASIRCSVCDSSKGDENCVSHPPAAQLCDGYDYCIAVAKYTSNGNNMASSSSSSCLTLNDLEMSCSLPRRMTEPDTRSDVDHPTPDHVCHQQQQAWFITHIIIIIISSSSSSIVVPR